MSQPQEQGESTQATDLLSALTNQLLVRAGGHINSVSIKLPEIWTTSPKVWFARVEAQFVTKNITQDQTRCDYVVSALDVKTAEEDQDVLVKPPDADDKATLKKALIKAFGKSQAQRDSELLNLNGLGDRKRTVLIRKINAPNDDPQTSKRALFLSNLPADVRSIPAGQEFSAMEKLAEAADRTWDARCAQVQHIMQATYNSSPTTVEAVMKPSTQTQRRSGPRAQPTPTSTLTTSNGTSVHTWGRRSVSLAIGRRRQYNDKFYLADVNRPTLDFFTKHGVAIDLRGKRLLSLDNISILFRETKSPLTLAGLGFPLPNKFSSLLQQFPELLNPHFNQSTNKHGVEHHIVTHGPPTLARARRLDLEKLSAAKNEFLQMEKMGMECRSKSAWSSSLHIVPKPNEKWRPCGDYRRLNASTDDDRYPLPHIQDLTTILLVVESSRRLT
ncbi:transposon Ty3-G Gag-Pol polyprotein [Elysia marginata]|uniref:Transposon Ty3-G Gag-Pol polyprotein n=1 Tax=Elysia marginata TaxID=1093978 RepID=A0AAV4JA75_9GAST|nr:transposon Ty3-G Gag-Pol polyprotein [Elysia marginata]